MPPFPRPLRQALDSALDGKPLPAGQALELLPCLDTHLLDVMAAARLAVAVHDRPVFTCGVVSVKSGRCGEDCAFCAQSARHAADPAVFPLLPDGDIHTRVRERRDAGADLVGLVTSGGGPAPADFDRLLGVVRDRVRADGRSLCASLGILEPVQAKALADAGLTRYHHNLETARSHYPAVCRTHGYDRRVDTVRNAKAAGLGTCSGGLFGIGESRAQRVELAATLAELDVDCVPVNFLNPIPGTPLADVRPLSPREALGTVALLRLMLPAKDIVVCGGRPSTLGENDRLLFSAGANGLMVGDYLTTAGQAPDRDRRLLRDLGLRP